jgi:hypothetical protein
MFYKGRPLYLYKYVAKYEPVADHMLVVYRGATRDNRLSICNHRHVGHAQR